MRRGLVKQSPCPSPVCAIDVILTCTCPGVRGSQRKSPARVPASARSWACASGGVKAHTTAAGSLTPAHIPPTGFGKFSLAPALGLIGGCARTRRGRFHLIYAPGQVRSGACSPPNGRISPQGRGAVPRVRQSACRATLKRSTTRQNGASAKAHFGDLDGQWDGFNRRRAGGSQMRQNSAGSQRWAVAGLKQVQKLSPAQTGRPTKGWSRHPRAAIYTKTNIGVHPPEETPRRVTLGQGRQLFPGFFKGCKEPIHFPLFLVFG